MRKTLLLTCFCLSLTGLMACGDDSQKTTAQLCEEALERDDYGESCGTASDCIKTECTCNWKTITMRVCANGSCQGIYTCPTLCEDHGGWACADR